MCENLSGVRARPAPEAALRHRQDHKMEDWACVEAPSARSAWRCRRCPIDGGDESVSQAPGGRELPGHMALLLTVADLGSKRSLAALARTVAALSVDPAVRSHR